MLGLAYLFLCSAPWLLVYADGRTHEITVCTIVQTDTLPRNITYVLHRHYRHLAPVTESTRHTEEACWLQPAGATHGAGFSHRSWAPYSLD